MAELIPAPDPGVYPNVPFDKYLAWDACDASFLRAMAHTPSYARWKRHHPQEDKACYAKGRLFHALTLEPDQVDREFIVKPATYTNDKGETKKWNGNATVCKQWFAQHAHLTPINADTLAEAQAMADRVRALPQLAQFLDGADVELSVVWVDKGTGLTCKARFDAYRNGIVLDLKSTSGSAGPFPWFAECQRHRYYLQAAQYIEGMIATGLAKGVPWFCFVACEAYPPHDVAVYDVQDDKDALSYDFLCYGRLRRAMLLQQTARCLKDDDWPGYPAESADMELTYQARKEMDELTNG